MWQSCLGTEKALEGFYFLEHVETMLPYVLELNLQLPTTVGVWYNFSGFHGIESSTQQKSQNKYNSA